MGKFRQSGKGENLVFLPGMGQGYMHCQNFLSLLKQDYCVIELEYPGMAHFKEKKWLPFTPLRFIAKEIICLLDEHNIQKTHLVGLSLGGMIATELAHLDPKRFQSLTLINSSLGFKFWDRLNPRLFLSLGVTKTYSEKYWKKLADFLFVDKSKPKFSQMVTTWTEAVKFHQINAWLIKAQLSSAIIFLNSSVLTKLKLPTLIVSSLRDRLVSPTCKDIFVKKIRHAKLRVIAESGHLPINDSPEILCQYISEFISDNKCSEIKHASA